MTALPGRKRLLRVVPIAWPTLVPAAATIAGNIAVAERRLAAVVPGSADLVCLPEGFLYHGTPASHPAAEKAAESEPLTDRFGQWARELNAWLLVPVIRATSGRIRNAVLVLDREGHLAGEYEKRYPWPSNPDLTVFEHGVTPGTRAMAVPTEFGPVGVQTCFDVNWRTGWDQLRAAGCVVIAYPSECPNGFALRVRAWETRTPVVSAVLRGGPSRVVDLTGEVIASVTPDQGPRVVRLNLNRCLVHLDHTWRRLDALARTGRIRTRRLRHDNVVTVSAPPDGTPIEAILSEAGIRPLDTYLSQAKEAIDACLDNVGVLASGAQLRAESRAAGP